MLNALATVMRFGITCLILVGQSVCGGGVEDNNKEEQVVLTQRNTGIRWPSTCRGIRFSLTNTNLALIITLT